MRRRAAGAVAPSPRAPLRAFALSPLLALLLLALLLAAAALALPVPPPPLVLLLRLRFCGAPGGCFCSAGCSDEPVTAAGSLTTGRR